MSHCRMPAAQPLWTVFLGVPEGFFGEKFEWVWDFIERKKLQINVSSEKNVVVHTHIIEEVNIFLQSESSPEFILVWLLPV